MRIVWHEGALQKSIEVDATLSEKHESTGTATEHPIESGSPISDHYIRNPRAPSFDVFVTNAPTRAAGSHMRGATGDVQAVEDAGANVLQWSNTFDRVRDVYGELLRLQDTRTVVRVESALWDYDDCLVSNVSAPRKADDAVTFSIDFQQIEFATVRSVQAPAPAETRGSHVEETGPETPTDATDAENGAATESLAHRLLGL